MSKLIITADIHGSYNSWLTIKALLKKDDSLAVAGDLFDTIYGSYSDPDFRPEAIKEDLKSFCHPIYYVYGNCDSENFTPGYKHSVLFKSFNKKIYLHHGQRPFNRTQHLDIIIQGHTHLCRLEKKNNQIFMNPGSIARPRNSQATYGVIDKTAASLIELKTGKTLTCIEF